MSLDLDERQRAMLQEMHVQVWWPMAAPPLVAVNAPEKVAIKSISTGTVARNDSKNPKNASPTGVLTAPSTPGTPGNPNTPSQAGTLGWAALQNEVTNCRACPLCEARKNTVFAAGPAAATGSADSADLAPVADWLFVGEAPGENEDQTGEPFVGQAGQLLDNMLKAIGASRKTNACIVNVVKCRPPANRNPDVAEVAQCEPFLRRQIELLQPKVIVAMGRFAVNALLQDTVADVAKLPLGKLRGQVHQYTHSGLSVPVVATYHPAYLLRNLPEKAKAWADLCLAIEVMKQLRG